MSRTIKFRVWDKKENRMYYSDNDEIVWTTIASEDASRFIMQSTGLKDRNGNELWESDIVELYYKGNTVRCVIVWNDNLVMFSLKWKDGYINAYPLNAGNYTRVGNSFENADLLN